MQVHVLGGIEVLAPDEVALGGPTQRRTLALLAMNVGEVVSLDRMIDGIWTNGDTPERAEHNVQTYVHRLRSAIGESGSRIETVGTGYRLHLDRDELDAQRFEDLVDDSRNAMAEADDERALQSIDRALELWRGRPYDDVADLDWARAEVARLDELRASAIERRFEALLAGGRHTEVIGPLREAVAGEPWREARRVQLALALYRAGRHAEALRAIQDYRSELAEDLGLDPSPEVVELEHQILEHDPTLMPASHQQHRLRDYQLDAVIGEGAFSLVWRGEQPSLGRTVAVKQIRAELANQPDFIRRFETEAQTVAALEHPHIVPLYDYWREPDSAYLVMRYVAGGSLEAAVLNHRLDDTALRRLVEQVGAALHTAHRAGIIHRDVKSANVLLDGDDNFFLTDFGIAFTGGDDDDLAASLSTGSPAYASPEQLRRQALDCRTDIYGFGITVFEAATGRLPFIDAPSQAALVARQLDDPVPAPSSIVPSVAPWVDEVVARATAKNPADRYSTMAELMEALPQLLTSAPDGVGGASATLVGELVNPFKALRAFREADAADFYGRGRLVDRFVEVLARPGSAGRLLAVVGPSGSGKSSAVRAGLLPRVRDGAVSGSDAWFITTMNPGGRPFEELESALSRVAVRQPGPLVELMRDDPRGIARAINQTLPDEDSELLLVIDQFEEAFTHAIDHDRTRFLDGLLEAVREPQARLRLVVTIRADFWDRPLRHSGLASRLETAAVTVSPLAADELEAAIVEPVRRQGAAYEPGLVARIIADVGDQPGALPLLQYALTELFDTNAAGLIRGELYDAIGGLAGALTRRAEETLEALSVDQRTTARRLFTRLVSLGEGTDDMRRRVRLIELGDDRDAAAVIDAFGDARLLVFDRDPSTREPTVEIAHESLLRAWPRLRGWIEADRDGLRIHRHLTETSAAWVASDRDAGDLYRGGRLEAGSAWAKDHRADLNATEQEFLDASVAAREAEIAAERDHLEQQVRSNRRLRVLVTVATVVAVVAALATVFAVQQRFRADDQAAEAERQALDAEAAREEATENADDARAALAEAERQRAVIDLQRLRSEAIAIAEEQPFTAVLLAIEAHRLDPGPASVDALYHTMTSQALAQPYRYVTQPSANVLRGWGSPLERVVDLPDIQVEMLAEEDARLHTALTSQDQVLLTSVSTANGASTVFRHDLTAVEHDPVDTGEEAIFDAEGEHLLWVSDEIVVLDPDGRALSQPVERPGDLVSFDLSANGEVFVLQRAGGHLDVYRTATGFQGSTGLPGTGPVEFAVVSLSADGSLLAAHVAEPRTNPTWSMWTTRPLEPLDIGAAPLGHRHVLAGSTLYLSPPGANYVVPSDPFTFEPVGDRLEGHTGYITDVVSDDEERLVATASLDGTVRVWDRSSETQLGSPIQSAVAPAFSEASGTKLVVHHADRVSIWNFDTSTWVDVACDTVQRNLTRGQWEEYGPSTVEFRATCERYPSES